jgi:hypothetical protein
MREARGRDREKNGGINISDLPNSTFHEHFDRCSVRKEEGKFKFPFLNTLHMYGKDYVMTHHHFFSVLYFMQGYSY